MKLVCQQCGKEFESIKNRKTCSRTCQGKLSNKDRIKEKIAYTLKCKKCNKEFLSYNENKRCCSRSCEYSYRYNDTVYRNMMLAKNIIAQTRDDVNEKRSNSIKEYYNLPGSREKASENSKEIMHRSDVINRIRESNIKFWSDENILHAHSVKMQEIYKNEELIKKISTISKERNNRPEYKEMQSIRMKLFWLDETNIDNIRNKMIGHWSDEEKAKKHFDACCKYKEFIMPSGKIVKVQGNEHIALKDLLEKYDENDIVIGVKNLNAEIGIITYIFNNKEHRYYPDFFIKSTNTIVEVKSNWTFNLHKDKNLAKEQSCLEKGFNFKFIII